MSVPAGAMEDTRFAGTSLFRDFGVRTLLI